MGVGLETENKLVELTSVVRGLAIISRHLLSEARTVSPDPDNLDAIEDMITSLDQRIEALRPVAQPHFDPNWRQRTRAALDKTDAVRHNRARAKEA